MAEIKNNKKHETAKNFFEEVRSATVSDIIKRIALGIVATVIIVATTLYADRQIVITLDGRVSALEQLPEQLGLIKDDITDIRRQSTLRDAEIQNINNTVTRVEEKIDNLLLKLAK